MVSKLRKATLFFAALGGLASSMCQRGPSYLPTLRTIAEIDQMSLAEAAQGSPVEVEGFVPYHGAEGRDTFICEKKACVSLDLGTTATSLGFQPGAGLDPLLRIKGKTTVADHRRTIAVVEAQVVGQIDATQDDPPPQRLGEVSDGKHDALFVATRGHVRGLHRVDGAMVFTLVAESRHVPTVLQGACADYPPVSDGEVRLLGVAVASHDATGKNTGARLLVSRCNALKIAREGPEDLFDGERHRTDQLSAFLDRRVVVTGTLRRSAGPSASDAVQDADGTVSVLAAEPPKANDGDAVAVSGYPERRGSQIVLADALIAKLPLEPRTSTPSKLPTLTTVAAVRRLSAEEAGRGYPVRLEAVVTYTYWPKNQFFIQDKTAGIYVEAWRHLWEVPAGQLVEVVGRTGPGLFAPIIDAPHVRVLGPAPLPIPEKVSFDDLMTGSHDSQWVEVEGLVRRVRRVGMTTEIDVIGIGLAGRLPVTIPSFEGALPKQLVDARVRIRGVCAFNFNNQRQPISVRLQAPDLSAVSVIDAAPSDPFALAITSLTDLLRFDSERELQHRVRIHGTVTLHVPGRFAYIQDGNNGVMVNTEQDIDLHPGDVVDAVGFPASGRAAPEMDDAVVRVAGRAAPPAPRAFTPEQVYDGDGDAILMTMKGRVVNSSSTGGEHILTIRDRSFLISAHIHQEGPIPTTWPEVDALVEMTGVCSVQEVSSATIFGVGRPQSFRLLMRSNDDIRIVEAPPWWTRGRVLAALVLVTSILAFSWLWLVSLQRTVRRQTAVIQMKLAREAALEERYRKLFEGANDIVFTLGLDARISSLNRAGRNLFGFSEEQAIGRNLIDLVAPGHEEQVRNIIRHRETDEAVAVYELDVLAPDGRPRTLEISSRPVWENGKMTAIEGIARDVTERKQAEQQILAFTAKLEQSNAELQSFADVASHDLQEPLRKVRGFAEKLAGKWDRLSREEIADVLQRMQRATERMQALIAQLLAYARLGNVKPQMVPVDLSAVAREVVEDLEARIEQTNGRVDVGPLPSVQGDATQLRQLVQNLVGNALKFNRPGEQPLVRVYVTGTDASGNAAPGRCEIAVQDNGIGFEQAEADRVFQAFYRAHHRQKYEGTGLGLAICQRIVERHGGKIRAVSAPGVGTTFLFTLVPAGESVPEATTGA